MALLVLCPSTELGTETTHGVTQSLVLPFAFYPPTWSAAENNHASHHPGLKDLEVSLWPGCHSSLLRVLPRAQPPLTSLYGK